MEVFSFQFCFKKHVIKENKELRKKRDKNDQNFEIFWHMLGKRPWSSGLHKNFGVLYFEEKGITKKERKYKNKKGFTISLV